VQGFTKSLAMTVLSEVGDKTFFAAAVGLLPPSPSRRLLLLLSFCLPCLPLLACAVAPCGCVDGPGALPPDIRQYAAAACLFARLLGGR
jgi:putative Ca2+/H+ antiporter (TMEM165/GDT1 family)